MRKIPSVRAWGTALTVTALVVTAFAPSTLAQPDEGPELPFDRIESGDVDNREGRIAPTMRQRGRAFASGARADWNDLGTVATLAATDGEPIADGLPTEPVATAEAFVEANQELLGLSDSGAAALELLRVAPMGEGAAVWFRQRFGDLIAGFDGNLVVGVRDGAVWHVSSSLARHGEAPEEATLSAAEAQNIAIGNAGLAGARVIRNDLVAVPTPDRGVRAAYFIELIADLDDPIAYSTYVDGRDGSVLVREDLVDYLDPEWEIFPNTPPFDYSSTDTRERWCWVSGPGCDEVVATSASPLAWDVDPSTGVSSNTTTGNNSFAVHKWFDNNAFAVGTELATPRPDRDYVYDWTNQWNEERCDPDVFESPERNDIDVARANLFAMHNRMHDWSYHLGFTETAANAQVDNFGLGGLGNDPERGNAQAGGVVGGPPGYQSRDNANQITPADGNPPTTNMYLWQPIPAAFYPPCVDGDYDMSVIAHEYGHLITNRMVAGPNAGLQSAQGQSESWSDLIAVAYLQEHGYAPRGLRGFTIGEYVTSDPDAGIRNYNMSQSPLNYSAIDYDFVGLQVHASGEVWSATNIDIRNALVGRYGIGNAAVQKSCANGATPANQCPGNRRWSQLMFDSYLLQAQSQNSYIDSRDALLAADMIRFGGANQDLLWNAFAHRGIGENAASDGHNDPNPTPSFTSPFANEATVTFRPLTQNGTVVEDAELFVGRYQARAVAMADTDAATATTDQVELVPGRYEFIVQAPGYGHVRVGPIRLDAGEVRNLDVPMRVNLTSSAAGATASGDGVNLEALIDDDEATNWASLGEPVAGKQVTVDLTGDNAHQVRRVNVSAMLRPAIADDPDPGTQNRFTALRRFRVLACNAAGGADCSDDAAYTVAYTSPADAFPSVAPRPRAPEMILRQFGIPPTMATHLRIEVVTNQCIGGPDYAGQQDNDPRHITDCATGSPQADNVRIAEFQAFG